MWWSGHCEVGWISAVTDPVVAAVPDVPGRVVAAPNLPDSFVVAAANLPDSFVVAAVPYVTGRLVAAVPDVADRVIGTVPCGSARGACSQHHRHRHAHNHCLHPEVLDPRHRLPFPYVKFARSLR